MHRSQRMPTPPGNDHARAISLTLLGNHRHPSRCFASAIAKSSAAAARSRRKWSTTAGQCASAPCTAAETGSSASPSPLGHLGQSTGGSTIARSSSSDVITRLSFLLFTYCLMLLILFSYRILQRFSSIVASAADTSGVSEHAALQSTIYAHWRQDLGLAPQNCCRSCPGASAAQGMQSPKALAGIPSRGAPA